VTAPAGPALRVVIADDDPRVRTDFTALLDLESDIAVVGTAADGVGAVEISTRLLPHVVVMDVRMPGRDGIEATRALRRRHHDRCRVLVVTTFDLDEYVLGAVRAGAAGFLLKDRPPRCSPRPCAPSPRDRESCRRGPPRGCCANSSRPASPTTGLPRA
jgi:DNA-binding NarL/FixJ family response regulator